jgi:FAD binding domain in molybdopterin dehydrogenase
MVGPRVLYPKSFAYVRAESVAYAVELLREYGDDARLLAGGARLIPLMKLRLANPGLVIDLAGVPGLRGTWRDDGHVSIGALTRHVELESVPLLTLPTGTVTFLFTDIEGSTIAGAVPAGLPSRPGAPPRCAA